MVYPDPMTDNRTVEQLRSDHVQRMCEKEVLRLDYHRNGVGGEGVWFALIRSPDADQKVLLAVVPEWAITAGSYHAAALASPAGGIPCYVIDPELASGPWTKPGTVEFGTNSWRGDHYFETVLKAVQAYEEEES